MQRTSRIVLAFGMTWSLSPSSALALDAANAESETTTLNEVTVSATRSPRRRDNIPDTVTTVRARQIGEQVPRDLHDLFADELDISVPLQTDRFSFSGNASSARAGNQSINIRGLEGNQVLMMIDGIRVPNSFSFGPFATGRGDYLDLNAFETIEVLRGPASAQYGSDGLAGAVSFRTFDPDDWLKPDETRGGFARLAYATQDQSLTPVMGSAMRAGRWQGLALLSFRQGHALENRGGNGALNASRTLPNPQHDRGHYALTKHHLQLNDAHRLGATIETLRRTTETEVYSARATPPIPRGGTLDMRAHDRIARDRISIEHRFGDINAYGLQQSLTSLYWQKAQITQSSAEGRAMVADRTRDNSYNQETIGFSSLLSSNLSTAWPQRISYGLDGSRDTITSLRRGTTPPPGESFPSKPFPDTAYTLYGAFVQDEIEIGSMSLIPALRLDRYALSASSAGYAGTPTDLAGRAVTPRLGWVWRLAPELAPYAHWSKGFRAPTPEQVNSSFANPVYGYTSIANPGLRAEHAESVELGLRGRAYGWRYSLAIYDNRYRDFIEQNVVGGKGTPSNPTVFQYVNLKQARIRGVELRSEWKWSARWTATAGAAWSRGDAESGDTRTPLNTVQPFRAAMGLRYEVENRGWRADVVHSEGKARDRIAPPQATYPPVGQQYASPAWTVLNLGAYWLPARQWRIDASLNNLFNTTYWRWSDVQGLADNSPVKDAYTAPGRNAKLSVRYEF
jgi:hemoglobin/transferrin/lactoferrin receptor protein